MPVGYARTHTHTHTHTLVRACVAGTGLQGALQGRADGDRLQDVLDILAGHLELAAAYHETVASDRKEEEKKKKKKKRERERIEEESVCVVCGYHQMMRDAHRPSG